MIENNTSYLELSKEKAQNSTLYVVATPIGNLEDITLRAIKTLKSVDMILCEDTRVTRKLLNHFGISQKTDSYNDHNAASKIPQIISMLSAGSSIALVSDAGTPLISDPGYKLVSECRKNNLRVVPIVGACATIAGLSCSGVATDSFSFFGFWDNKKTDSYLNSTKTLVFYESAKRIAKTLAQVQQKFGTDTRVTICRELTKLHEEVVSGSALELTEKYSAHTPKGEIVMIIERDDKPALPEDILSYMTEQIKLSSLKDASAITAKKFNISKKEAYEIGLSLK